MKLVALNEKYRILNNRLFSFLYRTSWFVRKKFPFSFFLFMLIYQLILNFIIIFLEYVKDLQSFLHRFVWNLYYPLDFCVDLSSIILAITRSRFWVLRLNEIINYEQQFLTLTYAKTYECLNGIKTVHESWTRLPQISDAICWCSISISWNYRVWFFLEIKFPS